MLVSARYGYLHRATLSIPEIPELYDGRGIPFVLKRLKKGEFFLINDPGNAT
jgi:hypothetical protein